jgi:hypothetical protein
MARCFNVNFECLAEKGTVPFFSPGTEKSGQSPNAINTPTGGFPLSGYSNQTNLTANSKAPRTLGLEISSWALVAAGATLAVVIINVMVVRPANWQLAQVRRQMAQLEAQVEKLVGQKDQVANTNTLLGQLAEQSQRRAEANASLDEIAQLHVRLNRHTGEIDRALRTVEKLAALEEALAANDDRIAEAAEALVKLENLQDRLTGRQYDTVQSHLAVDSLDKLRHRLLDAHCQSVVAEEGLDAIDGLHSRLASTIGANDAAEASLDELVALRDRVDNEGLNIEVAHQRVEQLIRLKDRTLDQTGDLVTATENLELMIDIQDQMQKVALTFGQMRHWITEIVAFEPTLNRAMRSLQPLVQLGDLRHMNATQLRQVVRNMSNQQVEQATDSAEAVAEETQEADSNTAAVPAIGESAATN